MNSIEMYSKFNAKHTVHRVECVNGVQRLAVGRAERTILLQRKLLRAAGIDFRVGGLGGWSGE